MVRVKWLKEARTDLKEIYEYIALDSKKYARIQVENIQKRTEILKSQPKLGRVVPEIGKLEILELIEGNYRIIYKLSENQIEIIMVHHAARDLIRRI